ncbi:hypothetical protein [Hypericibacter sp.]|uniref:hypothetical protein n=1 Tax=Hypericibacter sp. TaxID=2705401 RepID=UPI003D6D9A13
MKKRKAAKSAAKGRRPATKKPKAAAKNPAMKTSTAAARKPKPAATKSKIAAKKTPDPVELDSRDSFPASDPPSWVPVTGEGSPDRTGRKRRP